MRSATTFACVSQTKCPAPGMTSKFGSPAPRRGLTSLVVLADAQQHLRRGRGSSVPPLTVARSVRR